MIAVDFGTGAALAIHGPEGAITKKDLNLPRVKGGKTPRDEFAMVLAALLARDDVVVESPTVGSSGCEVRDVEDILAEASHVLYTLSARAVKNYRMDHNLPNPKSYGKYETISTETQAASHHLDAEVLYLIATLHPERLRKWHMADPCERIHTTVRPLDKRLYRGPESDAYMANLPPWKGLPEELKAQTGNGKGDYSRALVMPFAMAMAEPVIDDGPPDSTRRRFEKLVGLYDHGYPSFYRRMTITWMQEVAKRMFNLPRYKRDSVSPSQRKAAWKVTQRQIRHLFHLARALDTASPFVVE